MTNLEVRVAIVTGAEQCTVAALRAESPDVDLETPVGRPATERDAEIFRYALRGIKVPGGGNE